MNDDNTDNAYGILRYFIDIVQQRLKNDSNVLATFFLVTCVISGHLNSIAESDNEEPLITNHFFEITRESLPTAISLQRASFLFLHSK